MPQHSVHSFTQLPADNYNQRQRQSAAMAQWMALDVRKVQCSQFKERERENSQSHTGITILVYFYSTFRHGNAYLFTVNI